MKHITWRRMAALPRRAVVCLLFLAVPVAGAADEPGPAAADVLARAIAYHDPHGVWGTEALRLRERFDLSGDTRERLGFDRMTTKASAMAVFDALCSLAAFADMGVIAALSVSMRGR